MSRVIPGLQAEIIDFQIQSDPITNPGEIVVLLCDLPDQVTITDPENPDETITLAVPANVPLLINGTTDLKNLILGSELVEGLDTLIGNDRHLDIVNVLPMLSSELPLAVCKIVRRNGERPDTSIKKEVYEALEVAYENLENYPAGFVVPLGVSIEDIVVSNTVLNVQKVKEFAVTAISNTVFTEAEASAIPVSGYEEIVAGLRIELDSVVTETNLNFTASPKLTIKDNGGVVLLTETIADVYNLVSSDVEKLRIKYAALDKLARPNGILVSSTVPVSNDSFLPLIEEATIEANVAAAKLEKGYLIIDPTNFVDGSLTKTITKDVLVNGVKVATLVISYKLKKADAITFNNGSYTVDWASVTDDVIVKKVNTTSITPTTWYIGGTTFALKTSSNVDIASPVVYAAMPTLERTLTSINAKVNQIALTSSLELIELERGAFTVEKYIKATELRTSEPVLIDFYADTNTYANTALLTIEKVYKKNDVYFAEINDEEIALADIAISEISNKLFVTEDFDLNYKDSIKIKLLAGLELPKETSEFTIEMTVVPANAAFDKRAVEFCDYLTKQMNDCRVVFGTKPATTTSAEDIKEQVARVSKFVGSKSYVKGSLDAGAYLTVVTGAHKVNNCGGITNFSETKILAYDSVKKTVSVDSSLMFVKDDKVDLVTVKKGRIVVDENVVEDVIPTSTGFELTLKNSFSTTFLNTALTATKRIQISNAKDRSGSFLAALYAVTANNFGIDKAPFNLVLNGSSEILYSNNQLKTLTNAGITTIVRNTFDTKGFVYDTPTKAGDSSDFQDQGTFGLVLYFIRQLRKIATTRKGQRFGSADKQMIFQTELEAPFKAQNGITIVDYKLTVDFSKLNSANELNVAFEIKEAKKLKVVKISAKLF